MLETADLHSFMRGACENSLIGVAFAVILPVIHVYTSILPRIATGSRVIHPSSGERCNG